MFSLRTLKSILLASAMLVAGISLWVSHTLIRDLEKEEHNRMEIWAEAMRSFTRADADTDMTLVLKVLAGNHSIPVIVTDADHQVLDTRNLPDSAEVARDPARIRQMAEKMKAGGRQVCVHLTGNGITESDADESSHCIFISYGESLMLQRLALYPYVQLGVVALLAVVALYALLASKRAEQNKVWVGLSRETAHQLGTPISSLTAWNELLHLAHPEEPLLQEMESDLSRLRLIAERFSKIGSAPELHSENLTEVVNRVAAYISRRASDQVHMECSYPSAEVRVKLNAPLFEWVIENLCKNAIDAMEGHGEIHIYVYRSSNHVVIDVADTGKGIPARHLRDVFRPGFTTKQRGWGLGLALARRIVEEYHKGHIRVKRSQPGVGTTFTIELPCHGKEESSRRRNEN